MNAFLSQIATHLNSSVFVLLGLLFAVGVMLYKIGGWKERFLQHSKRLDKFDNLNDKIVELSTKIQLIYENTNPRPVVASHSPLDLTDFGREIAASITAEEVFSRYQDKLAEAMNQSCPPGTNAYDIQVAALNISRNLLPNLLSSDEINKAKDAAFRHGILLDDLWAIFGVFLRDAELSKRNIPVIDVDRHAPARN